jgi:hypothetical protein
MKTRTGTHGPVPFTCACFVTAALVLTATAYGQTTQGLLTGQVYDRLTGQVIAGAKVEYENLDTRETGETRTNTAGIYAWNNLSPATYAIKVTVADYQLMQSSEIRLFVAGRVELDVPLRPLSDLYDQKSYFNGVIAPPRRRARDSAGRVIHFYAADIETTKSAYLPVLGGESGVSQSAVSYVIDSRLINDLPLLGRDVYAALSIVAGVTSDAPTSRSLGLAVNGQRPSASNFLLDGVENNNYLVTGPLSTVTPEAVQEYRISTNSFSAEFGRTSGYLANVITRSGGNAWHGMAWANAKNEALNANEFQRNLGGKSRIPVKEWEPGFALGGPLRRDRLFSGTTFDHLRFRSRLDSRNFILPTTSFQPRAGTIAERLLQAHPTLTLPGPGPSSTVPLSPPSTLNRYLATQRGDYLIGRGEHRIMGRVAISDVSRPDFVWSPYSGFSTGLDNNSIAVAGSWTGPLPGGFTGEARIGWNSDNIRFDRPHPEVPSLVSDDGTTLPGSRTFYAYRNRSRGAEVLGNVSKLVQKHLVKFGAGVLSRRIFGYLTAARDGQFLFSDLTAFGNDQPAEALLSVSRLSWPRELLRPDYDRNWSYTQLFAYAQDSYKVKSGLVLNYGFRYENYGAPRATGGGDDAIIQLGPGTDIRDRFRQAELKPLPRGEDLFHSAADGWSARGGFAYSLRDDARTVLRGAYGLYYDRPFDNLWQNLRSNNNLFAHFAPAAGFNYLGSHVSFNRMVRSGTGVDPTNSCDYRRAICDNLTDAQFTVYADKLPNARVHNFFLGLQHRLSDELVFEVTGLGSRARNLITTDTVNRIDSVALASGNPEGRLTPRFAHIRYRSAQGASDYNGLTAVLRYSTPAQYLQFSYTWSHTIDNQSDPLVGDFFDLTFTLGGAAGNQPRAAFTKQFDPTVDRGNSDFDQRHNVAFFSVWQLPRVQPYHRLAWLLREWKFSQLAAVRSGLPFSVYVPENINGFEQILNNRAELVRPELLNGPDEARSGAKLILNPAAFAVPPDGRVGNTGRNAFRGPGFFNLDCSLSRSFPLAIAGEAGRLTVRADAFNVLNHANLNNPVSTLRTQGFGLARYGRLGRDTGFPAQSPFQETARQIQLRVRLDF